MEHKLFRYIYIYFLFLLFFFCFFFPCNNAKNAMREREREREREVGCDNRLIGFNGGGGWCGLCVKQFTYEKVLFYG